MTPPKDTSGVDLPLEMAVCELAAVWGVPPWVVEADMTQEWWEWGLLWLGVTRQVEAKSLKHLLGG